jgi:predicted N-formylglutamate amidohydrolase
MYFRPYHGAIEKAIEERLLRGKRPVLVSMHSFTPVMNSVERPWKIGILWNEDSRLPKPLIARLRAMGLPVGDNQPYSGRYGYSQHVHGDDRGLASALIELRQDLIDTHHGAEEWGELLAGVLQEILGDPELYLPFKPRQSG